MSFSGGIAKAHLEFARQIRLAIKGIDKPRVFLRQFQLHALNPDLVIRAGLGQERVGDGLGMTLDFIHQRAGCRSRRRHYVAIDVAASGQCRRHGVIEALHKPAQRPLGDAVKLKALAGGDAERVIAVLPAKLIERQINFRCERPARQSAANHVNVLFAGFALVPVILLVDAVKLHELVIVVRKPVLRRVIQSLANSAGEQRVISLETFVAGRFRNCVRVNHK